MRLVARPRHELASAKTRIAAWWRGVDAREKRLLAASMVLGAAVVVVYTLVTRPNGLAGDQSTYHEMGVYFTQGKLWWADAPYGIPHASSWKAPLYPAWVGFWYELLGASPTRLSIVQGLVLAPATVFLTWLLARRLFGRTTALSAAAVVAVLPVTWEFIALLYPEALAIPLSLAAMAIFLGREPTKVIVVATGVVVGVCMLVRPNSFFLLAGALATWWVLSGWRTAFKLTALATLVAALVVLPWTIRNAFTADGFVPISVQDAAVYGTFNESSANDDRFPYAWRAVIDPAPHVFSEPDTSDAELRSELIADARSYIRENPFSLVEAYFWNGFVRLWDIQRPANVRFSIEASGRSEVTGFIGFGLHWLMVPLALVALGRLRARPSLLFGLLALAVALSVSVIAVSNTRYRAPVEPVIVILACATAASLRHRAESRTAQR